MNEAKDDLVRVFETFVSDLETKTYRSFIPQIRATVRLNPELKEEGDKSIAKAEEILEAWRNALQRVKEA